MTRFVEEFSLEIRKNEAIRIREKYPDRIPVIVEKANDSVISELDKRKYLVPYDLTMSQFIFTVRKRIKLTPEKAIFMFVNNTIPSGSTTMYEIYQKHHNDDKFLYFQYSGETAFGKV